MKSDAEVSIFHSFKLNTDSSPVNRINIFCDIAKTVMKKYKKYLLLLTHTFQWRDAIIPPLCQKGVHWSSINFYISSIILPLPNCQLTTFLHDKAGDCIAKDLQIRDHIPWIYLQPKARARAAFNILVQSCTTQRSRRSLALTSVTFATGGIYATIPPPQARRAPFNCPSTSAFVIHGEGTAIPYEHWLCFTIHSPKTCLPFIVVTVQSIPFKANLIPHPGTPHVIPGGEKLLTQNHFSEESQGESNFQKEIHCEDLTYYYYYDFLWSI